MEREGPASTTCPFLRRQSTKVSDDHLLSYSHQTPSSTAHMLTIPSKRDFSTMANANRSPSPDSLFVSEDDHYNNGHTSRRAQPTRLALPRTAPRFAGDGLDFRSPVMSEGGGSNTGASRNTAMVIDLTEEDESPDMASHAPPAPPPAATASSSRAQRLPRYGRNIIDMTSDAEEEPTRASSSRPNITDFIPPPSHRRDHHPRISLLRRPQRHNTDNSTMSDLEFVGTRPRSRPQSVTRSHTPAAPAQRSVTPYPTGIHDTIDLTEDDDDVVHVDTRTRGGDNLTSPGATGGVGTRSTAERGFAFTGMLQSGSRLLQRLGNFGAAFDGMTREVEFLEQTLEQTNAARTNIENRHQHLRFAQPPPARVAAVGVMPMMDYDMTGFDMGFGGHRPPTPKYEPPEPPAEGFTRSPGEDEVVVCPNCGDELAVGESENKQEVWVIKKCGHVYCGDCAENRHKGSSKGAKKGKGKAPVTDAPTPFKQCVVDGCNESASSKSMVRVFFGG